MVVAEDFALSGQDALGGTDVGIEEGGVFTGADDGEGEAADFVHEAGGEGVVFVDQAEVGELFGNDGGGEAVTPDGAEGWVVEGLAEVRADGDGEAEAFNALRSEDGDGAQDAGDGQAMGDKGGVGDGEDLGAEGGVGGDEVHEVAHGDAVIVDALEDAQGDGGEGRDPEMGPWDAGCRC